MDIVLHLLCHEPTGQHKVEKDQQSASKRSVCGEMKTLADQGLQWFAQLKRTKSMHFQLRTNSGPNFAPISCNPASNTAKA